MNRKLVIGLFTFLVCIGATVAWFATHWARASTQPTPNSDQAGGVATVSTTTIKTGQVSETTTAYGNVTAQPGAVVVVSALVDCRVKHLLIASGQSVEARTPVIEIEPSPETRLQLIDARNALEGAEKDAATTQQRLDLKLATNSELQIANRLVDSARLKFDDLTRRGAGDVNKTIIAESTGVIGKVDVQEGQLVPAGGALVELVPAGQIEVRLGVEPADAMLLHADQSVQLFASTADDDEPVDATIRLISHRINPDSRLVDVFIKPSDPDGLLLDSFVRGELTIKTVSGLVVPHDALLPDEQGFSIFTVVDGRAIKHAVKVAVQSDQQAVITGDGLHEGDSIVVTGNLELDDKAAVNATAATAAPAESEGEK